VELRALHDRNIPLYSSVSGNHPNPPVQSTARRLDVKDASTVRFHKESNIVDRKTPKVHHKPYKQGISGSQKKSYNEGGTQLIARHSEQKRSKRAKTHQTLPITSNMEKTPQKTTQNTRLSISHLVTDH
jgi:hypothetical protein